MIQIPTSNLEEEVCGTDDLVQFQTHQRPSDNSMQTPGAEVALQFSQIEAQGPGLVVPHHKQTLDAGCFTGRGHSFNWGN